MNSQNISKQKIRVQTLVTKEGDTLVQFKLKDAKTILIDLIDKQYVDSLLVIYEQKDSINTELISIKTEQIRLYQQKSINYENQISNLNKILGNKDSEIKLKDDEIKRQKKEIRRQKTFKILSFIGMGLTILIVLVTH